MIFSTPSGKGKSAWIKEYEWYAATIQYWGKEKALKFHRVLAKQGVQWNRGHTMISQLTAAGLFLSDSSIRSHRIDEKIWSACGVGQDRGSGIRDAFPIAVAAKARHPNAAKLLMDFILSREAQLVLRNANRSSGRLDVEPLVPEMHRTS